MYVTIDSTNGEVSLYDDLGNTTATSPIDSNGDFYLYDSITGKIIGHYTPIGEQGAEGTVAISVSIEMTLPSKELEEGGITTGKKKSLPKPDIKQRPIIKKPNVKKMYQHKYIRGGNR